MGRTLRERLARLLFGRPIIDTYRDQLVEARSQLDKETSSLQKDVDKVGKRHDRVEAIIRNIKQVRENQ